MVSRNEDMINFDKLERDVIKAVNADEKYQRENDAKFRAVNQKVASYEEFRDIVLASNLKPLEKNERIEQVTDKFVNKWNVCADQNKDSTASTQQDSIITSVNLPKNGMELARDWRRNCKTDEQKYKYILHIGGTKLRDIFKAEISQGLLGEIICALCVGYKDEDACNIANVLENLSKVNRFSLSLQFLSVKELDYCKDLFHKVGGNLGIDKDCLTILKKEYCIT